MSNPKAKSPYQRKQKKPHVYSEQYRSWRSAVKKWGASSLEARKASEEHAATFLKFPVLTRVAGRSQIPARWRRGFSLGNFTPA